MLGSDTYQFDSLNVSKIIGDLVAYSDAIVNKCHIGLYNTNSNNYSFGNHFFKVLVQIPSSHLKPTHSIKVHALDTWLYQVSI